MAKDCIHNSSVVFLLALFALAHSAAATNIDSFNPGGIIDYPAGLGHAALSKHDFHGSGRIVVDENGSITTVP